MNFECAHVIPESRNGETTIENLRPICGVCKSIGINVLDIEKWNTGIKFLKFDKKIIVNE